MFRKNYLLGLMVMLLTLAIVDGTLSSPLDLPQNRLTENHALLHSEGNPPVPDQVNITSGNILRSYRIQIPNDYNKTSPKKWPLIIDFHGRHSSSEEQWNNSQYFLKPSGREYFIVYPQGCLGKPGKHGPESAWQGAPYANASCDDILFTSDLVQNISATYNINSRRIYASGKSNGGGFVDTLACNATGELFAAFAMASAALYTDTLTPPVVCKINRARRILEAHGSNDTIIPYTGRRHGSTPDIAKWTSRWAERNSRNGRNGCGPIQNANITFPPWGRIINYPCNGQPGFIQQYLVNNLGHCWASAVPNADSGKPSQYCPVPNLDFTQAVLDFFAM